MSEPKTIDFLKEQQADPEIIETFTTANEEPGTALIVLDQVKANAVQVFSTEKGLDPVIEEIKRRVKSENFDISTEEGRLRIGSVARQIGSAKMRLKDMAMELTEDWRTKTAAVTKERTRMEKELDALRDEIKDPLDKWKESEEIRKAQHEADILFIEQASAGSWADMPLEELQQRRESLNQYADKDWQEFVIRGEAALKSTITILDDGIAKKEQWIKDQAELEASRKKEQERKDAHTTALSDIRAIGEVNWPNSTIEALDDRLKDLTQYESRQWEEYENDAAVALAAARDNIEAAKVSRKKWDDDQAELERRRKEEVENARKAALEKELTFIRNAALFPAEPTISQIADRKQFLEIYKDFDWQEFKEEADAAIVEVTKALDDAQAAEEEKIKKAEEAADTNRKNALLAAITEIKALGAFIETPTTQQIIGRVNALEPYRKKDWQEFKTDADKAIADVSKSLEASLEAAKDRADQARRNADLDHQRGINNKAAAAIEEVLGQFLEEVNPEIAKAIVVAIIGKKVPNVTITS